MSRPHTELSDPQLAFLEMTVRYALFVGGYRSGKTFVNVYKCIRDILSFPRGTKVYYYMPTFDMVTQVALPVFEKVFAMLGYGKSWTYKRNENCILLPGNRMIVFRTMDNLGSIAGYESVRHYVDEIELLSPVERQFDAWRQIAGRTSALLYVRGKLITPQISVTTTPDCGFTGITYKKWGIVPTLSAEAQKEFTDYAFVRSPVTANSRNLDPGYEASLRRDYPEKIARALIDGDWVNLTNGLVYTDYDRARCRSSEVVSASDHTIYVGMDFNVGKMAAIVNVRRPNLASTSRFRWEYHAVREFVKVLDTPTMIGVLQDQYRGKRVVVFPDCAGVSRKSSDASISDITLLQRAGFETLYHPAHPPVKDRVLAMNSAFKTGAQKVNDDLCPTLATGLSEQPYDKNGEPSKTGDIDHPLDAQGYLIEHEMPISRRMVGIGVSTG